MDQTIYRNFNCYTVIEQLLRIVIMKVALFMCNAWPMQKGVDSLIFF